MKIEVGKTLGLIRGVVEKIDCEINTCFGFPKTPTVVKGRVTLSSKSNCIWFLSSHLLFYTFWIFHDSQR